MALTVAHLAHHVATLPVARLAYLAHYVASLRAKKSSSQSRFAARGPFFSQGTTTTIRLTTYSPNKKTNPNFSQGGNDRFPIWETVDAFHSRARLFGTVFAFAFAFANIRENSRSPNHPFRNSSMLA